MKVYEIFCIVSNCLGLNFYDFKAPIILFLLFHFFAQSLNIFSVFYYPYYMAPESWYSGHGIYSVTQIYQSILPFLMQNFFVIRAFLLRNGQKYLSEKLRPNFTQKIGKCEKNFLIRVFFIIFVRGTKYLWVPDEHSGIFNSHTAFPELICSSNDLMFIYYVELLIEYLEFINCKAQMMRTQKDMIIIKRRMCEIFSLKRKILERYSIDILITVSYNFVLTIISLYWVIMRLIFRDLEHFADYATFLHFLEPMFIYWILFSRCEKFYAKVCRKSSWTLLF